MWSGAPRAIPILAALALVAATAGCARSDAFAPACPQLSLLKDGADLSRFNGNGRDITDLVVNARIDAVPAACHNADRRGTKVEATMKVGISAARGPAMRGRTTEIPYFVAVTEDGRVLDRQGYTAAVEFPPNTDRVEVTSPEITMLFPVSPDKSAAAYRIWVSLQLTPEEMAYNRRSR
jgi:hypothetical protein